MKYSFLVIYLLGIVIISGCHHEPPITDNSVSSTAPSSSDDDTKKQTGKRALVIGINNYSDQRRIPNLKDLNHAVDDALAIQTRLENMGFQVDVLPDEQATKNGIFRKLSEYRTMGCNSQFILFYSGHGTTDDREGYIVSSDGAKISFDELRQKTIDLPPKHILYIFDSCHSGFFDPAVQAKWTCKKASCAVPQGQERESRPAVYTLTAGSSKEETMEAESKWFGHSYFTYHLLKGLDGAADINNDCKITASELGVYLTQAIPLQQIDAEDVITAKQIGNNETTQRQNPLFNRVFGEGEISFIPPRCKENQKVSPQQQQLFPDKTWETSDAYKGRPAYREPTQLLVDRQNNLYVLDTPAGKVDKFDADGKYLLSYSHENLVPTSMALLDNDDDDPVIKRHQRTPNRVEGRYLQSRAFYKTVNNETVNSSASSEASSLWIYYSSDERGKVVIYEEGKQPRRWGGEKTDLLDECFLGENDNIPPKKGLLTIDAENNIILANQETGILTKCTMEGKRLAVWGKPEPDPKTGEENYIETVTRPEGLAVDKFGYIYVADTGGHGIQRYSFDGTWLSGWINARGDSPYFFNSPHGVAVDADFHVYIADTDNNRIKKYSIDGKELLACWGKQEDVDFNRPQGVAVSSDGRFMYVADTDNKRVQRFSFHKNKLSL